VGVLTSLVAGPLSFVLFPVLCCESSFFQGQSCKVVWEGRPRSWTSNVLYARLSTLSRSGRVVKEKAGGRAGSRLRSLVLGRLGESRWYRTKNEVL
jgi:hypothetical protein